MITIPQSVPNEPDRHAVTIDALVALCDPERPAEPVCPVAVVASSRCVQLAVYDPAKKGDVLVILTLEVKENNLVLAIGAQSPAADTAVKFLPFNTLLLSLKDRFVLAAPGRGLSKAPPNVPSELVPRLFMAAKKAVLDSNGTIQMTLDNTTEIAASVIQDLFSISKPTQEIFEYALEIARKSLENELEAWAMTKKRRNQ